MNACTKEEMNPHTLRKEKKRDEPYEPFELN